MISGNNANIVKDGIATNRGEWGKTPTLRNYSNISSVIIAQTLIPLSLVFTHVPLSFYMQTKVDTSNIHRQYAKTIILKLGRLAPPMGHDAHHMGILPQQNLYAFSAWHTVSNKKKCTKNDALNSFIVCRPMSDTLSACKVIIIKNSPSFTT